MEWVGGQGWGRLAAVDNVGARSAGGDLQIRENGGKDRGMEDGKEVIKGNFISSAGIWVWTGTHLDDIRERRGET